MLRKILLLVQVLVIFFFTASGQPAEKKQIKKAWKKIPANIEECMNSLDFLFSDTAKKYFVAREEKAAVSQFNMIQGMAIRNNWKLWRGSVLSRYFNSYNIYNPESMSWFILTSYHRKLNGKPINFENQIEEHFAFVERMKRNPPRRTDSYKIGDTLTRIHYESRRSLREMVGKQPGYETKAIVKDIDTIAQKIQLQILKINRTDTRAKEEVDHCNCNKNNIMTKGALIWTDVTFWMHAKQFFIIHAGR